MDNINEIISANLVKLRKKNKLTQAELAEKIHYSDKSISKWEKGESCPSIAVAFEIAKYYGITLNDLTDENLETEEVSAIKPNNYSYHVITLLACSVVWLVATIAFIYSTLFTIPHPWMSFVYAIPITCIVLLIFNSLWGIRRMNYLIISFFTWSFLLCIFMYVLVKNNYEYVMWVIFILGIPVQISIFLWSQLKRQSRAKANNSKRQNFSKNSRADRVALDGETVVDENKAQ